MVGTFIVDAFTNKPFSGNPAAVCVYTNDYNLAEERMQNIAAEMNLSETAFLSPIADSGDVSSSLSFSLRWFTPICEVKLCGHATLATAAVLFQIYHNINTTISFTTLSGSLKAIKSDDNQITLDFPSSPPLKQDLVKYNELIKVITNPDNIFDCQYSPGTRKLLLRLPDGTSRKQLESLTVDTNELMKVEQNDVKGIIITIKCNDESGKEEGKYDFYSRYFAPWVGIKEDPVTGSAHTVLGPYWSQVLNKSTLNARQCSQRGGDLTVSVNGDRVSLTGAAVIVLQGKMYF